MVTSTGPCFIFVVLLILPEIHHLFDITCAFVASGSRSRILAGYYSSWARVRAASVVGFIATDTATVAVRVLCALLIVLRMSPLVCNRL